MFALVGQVERAFRGREAFQEIDQIATIGGLANCAAEPTRRGGGRPRWSATRSAQALVGRPGPGPSLAPRGPPRRELPADTELDTCRPGAGPSDPMTSAPSSSSSPRPSGRSSWPAAASSGPGPRPTSSGSPSSSRSRSSPAGAAPTSSRTITRSTSGWPARQRRASVRERLDGADAILVIGCRLNEIDVRSAMRSRPGPRAGRTSTSSPSRPAGLPPRRTARSPRCPGVPARGQRTARWQAVLDAEPVARPRRRQRRRIAPPGRPPPILDADDLGRAGVHPAGRHDASPAAPGRRDPDDRRGQLRGWAAPRLPVPPARHVPRADLGSDGLRAPGGDRRGLVHRDRRRGACRRRRVAMTMAELETAVREKAVDRDRLRQRALRGRSGCIRTRRGKRRTGDRDRSRTDRLRRDRPGARGARDPRRARRRVRAGDPPGARR